MLIDRSVVEELERRLPDAPGLRIATVEVDLDPLDLVESGAHLVRHASYFSSPDGGEIGALGTAWRADAPSGDDRFSVMTTAIAGTGLSGDVPVMVGFAFDASGAIQPEWDGFTPASAVIPAVVARRDDRGCRLMLIVPPGADSFEGLELVRRLDTATIGTTVRPADHSIESRPAPAAWEAAVAEAVASVTAGELEKVVLTRSLLVGSDVAAPPFGVVRRLRADYPGCYVFGWQEGDAVFVGASPELLIAKEGASVRSHPLAGSAARGLGEDADQALGEALMASSKNRVEHRVVVDDIAERLSAVCVDLAVDDQPSLRKVTHVQHLSTEISGTVGDGARLIDLAGLIHPTPAVGGSPRHEALAAIHKLEHHDRGWYAGGIGWTTASGDGEVALALRCALLRGTRSWLYAGAGIVADSVPAEELEETRLKFRTMLDIVTEA